MFEFWGIGQKRDHSPTIPPALKKVALIVEDDPALSTAMGRFLSEEMRFHVLSASSYDSAVRHLETQVPHVVCINLGLPSQSGYELCEYIRGHPAMRWIPVLVTSAQSFPEDMAHAEEAGANAFLGKPFAMRRLGAYVTLLLEGSKVSRPGMRLLRLF